MDIYEYLQARVITTSYQYCFILLAVQRHQALLFTCAAIRGQLQFQNTTIGIELDTIPVSESFIRLPAFALFPTVDPWCQ